MPDVTSTIRSAPTIRGCFMHVAQQEQELVWQRVLCVRGEDGHRVQHKVQVRLKTAPLSKRSLMGSDYYLILTRLNTHQIWVGKQLL